MKVFVINCGSSSIKFHLYEMPGEILILKGKAEKNQQGDTTFVFMSAAREWSFGLDGYLIERNIEVILEELVKPGNNVLKSIGEVDAAGHRLIHGAENNTGCVEITDEVLREMKQNISLAPLHYPSNLAGIELVSKMIPGALQAGVFDTSFHHTLPPKAFLYGIPLEWYTKHRIRRYGFHGTSHKYAANLACRLTGIDIRNSRIITCHLGNGASVAAIRNGESVDTSMGMTPVEGLLMGSRCGDIDAGVLSHLLENYHLSLPELNELINRKGGLLGISGVSADYRKIGEAARNGNVNASLALEIYHYRIRKYIGAYTAVLNGIDALVFTGGIGENSTEARREICNSLDWFGVRLSHHLNRKTVGKEAVISRKGSTVKVVVVPANEELAIAREVARLAPGTKNDRGK